MIVDVALPLSLAFIMFSLGFGLTPADFGRVLTMPKAVATGVVMQIVAVPLTAFVLLQLFNLPPALAFGVMLLSFCPGGVTSNVLTKLGAGNVALSITLTAVVSLLSVVTVPLLVSWAASAFLEAEAPDINVTSIAIAMFAITVLPVLLGLGMRKLAAAKAEKLERVMSRVAVVLFAVIVFAAIGTNWVLITENFAHLGPFFVSMNILLLVVGVLVARVIGLSGADGICIAIEMGVQNAALGIAVAGLVANAAGITEYAVPSALYGIIMYLVTIPAIFILRRLFNPVSVPGRGMT
ncbi:Sodium Bile acid symporter family protein [Roseovarius albus]|uniref:Sodium Bile acid symporter family protein n=1 Tax=Roseovarius albus TaxID=1247867 RepID=A0A1X6ZHB7_9RHOB|nr:bile acid:sodium symporter family protein [Roseovarius albus]SLN51245.1 Sodium Bile acid symporter family protein [Roseovarius albus]